MNITIRRSDRRRSASIEIHPGPEVIVQIPARFPESRALELIEQKKPWIEKKLKLFHSLGPRPKPKQWVNGEMFEFLGESYRLEIIRGKRGPVLLRDQKLVLQLSTRDDPKRSLIRWYQAQALIAIQPRVLLYSEEMGLFPKSIFIKNYKARWGACSTTGELYFNWRLVLAPLGIIDYVVVHELAHLKVRNHSPRFWNVVERGLPEYKIVKESLRKMDYQGLLNL